MSEVKQYYFDEYIPENPPFVKLADHLNEITKLKELIRKAVPIVSKVSGIEAHTLWKELREAAK